MTVKERFRKHSLEVYSGCVEWIGALNKDGYGHFLVNKKTVIAHRFSYELYISPIPEGMSVLHRCDNSKCVNPKHLFVGTQSDNIKDCIQKGRFKSGPNKERKRK